MRIGQDLRGSSRRLTRRSYCSVHFFIVLDIYLPTQDVGTSLNGDGNFDNGKGVQGNRVHIGAWFSVND